MPKRRDERGWWVAPILGLCACAPERSFEYPPVPAGLSAVVAVAVAEDGSLARASRLVVPHEPIAFALATGEELHLAGYTADQLEARLSGASEDELALELGAPKSCRDTLPPPSWHHVLEQAGADARPLPPLGLSGVSPRCPAELDPSRVPRVDWGCSKQCPPARVDHAGCSLMLSGGCGAPVIAAQVLPNGTVCAEAPPAGCSGTAANSGHAYSCPEQDCYPSLYTHPANEAWLTNLWTLPVTSGTPSTGEVLQFSQLFNPRLLDVIVEEDQAVVVTRNEVGRLCVSTAPSTVTTLDLSSQAVHTASSVPCLSSLARGEGGRWLGLTEEDGHLSLQPLDLAFQPSAPRLELGPSGEARSIAGLAPLMGEQGQREGWLAARACRWVTQTLCVNEVELVWTRNTGQVLTSTRVVDGRLLDLGAAVRKKGVAVFASDDAFRGIRLFSVSPEGVLRTTKVDLRSVLDTDGYFDVIEVDAHRWMLPVLNRPALVFGAPDLLARPLAYLTIERVVFSSYLSDAREHRLTSVAFEEKRGRVWVAFASYEPALGRYSSYLTLLVLAPASRPGEPPRVDHRFTSLWLPLPAGDGPITRLRVSSNGERLCGLLPGAGKVFCANIVQRPTQE